MTGKQAGRCRDSSARHYPLDIALCLGLALYPATQLRFGGAPAGIGELMLLVWLFCSFFSKRSQAIASSKTAVLRIGAFWATLVAGLSIGAMVGFWHEPFQFWSGMVRDIAAYAFMLALSLTMARDFRDAERRRRAAWTFLVLGSGALAVQLTWWVGLSLPLGADPWYYDRLRGWAEDPNQLGLFAALMTLVSLQAIEWSAQPWALLAAVVSAGMSVLVGIATDSDTYSLSLIGALCVYGIVKARALYSAPDPENLRRPAVVLAMIFLPLLGVSTLPAIGDLRQRLVSDSVDLYDKDGQGDLRLSLWSEATNKGLEVGMLGLGPGPHLSQKYWKYAPPYKAETHNTSLELFAQGGLLAMTAFVGLCVSTFVSCWRSRLAASCALVTGLIVFSLTHHIIRHPLFWFGLTLALLESTAGSAGSVVRSAQRPRVRPVPEISPE